MSSEQIVVNDVKELTALLVLLSNEKYVNKMSKTFSEQKETRV